VDDTPDVATPAPRSAHDLRAKYYVGRAGYREIDWRPATVAGHPAWRWEFLWLRRHKVDYFVNGDCGTGYGILGSTTPGHWDKYVGTFERAVDSIELTC
jgi:hypothetical protein